MGGMIAVKMAEIFASDGEEVLEVVLIDSTNPEGYPAFHSSYERDEVADWTYKAYAGRSGLPGLEDLSDGESDILSMEDDSDSALSDEDDDEVEMMEYLPRMRKHIYNSLDLIAQEGYLAKELHSPVALIKCTQLTTFPNEMSDERKNAIECRFQDERAGWAMGDFQSIPLDAQHDDVFDPQHVGKVTNILKGVLDGVR